MGSLQQAYQSIYYNEQELCKEVTDFCNEFLFDTEEETEYFVEELFKDEDIALEFFDDVLEFSSESQLNEDTYITEIRSALIKYGLKAAKGLLKKATPAVRGMSAKTLTKQGIQAGGLTKKGTSLAATNPPAFATQTRAIQTARATRQAGIPKPQEPNKYLKMLQQKRASKGLPPAGGTSAQSLKAITQRGITRHNQAVAQATTVAQSFMKTMKQGAASSKLATAAKGTKNIGPAIPMKGAKPGGALSTTVKDTGLGAVPKVEKVKVKDLGPAPTSGGPTRYQGTRSGGQLSGKDVKGLPGAGQANNRRNLAQQKLDAAAKGSSSTGTRYSSQGVRQLGPEKLSSKVKRTMSNIKNKLVGIDRAKLAGAGLVGLAAAGFIGGDTKDTVAKKTGEINLPNKDKDTAPTAPSGGVVADKGKDVAPTTPPGGVVADKGTKGDSKGSGGYTIPDAAKPKTRLDAALTGIKPGAGVPSREDELNAKGKKRLDKVKKRFFDIRDRDITARAQFDPRLKSERERMKRIRAERKKKNS